MERLCIALLLKLVCWDLWDLISVFVECLVMENSGKSLLNLGLEYYCLKCDGVISQWVASILV